MHFSPSPPTSQWPWPWPQVASRKKQRQSVSVWLLSEASILVLDIQFLCTAVHAVLSLFGIILSSFLSLSIFLESLPALEKPIKRKRKQRSKYEANQEIMAWNWKLENPGQCDSPQAFSLYLVLVLGLLAGPVVLEVGGAPQDLVHGLQESRVRGVQKLNGWLSV